MIINKNIKLQELVVLVSLAFLLLPSVSAFANTFLEDKTMHLWKGEIGKYCIYLQNTGEEDIVQVIRIFEGEEYIRNLDEIDGEFDVSVGTISDQLPICMKLKLPRSVERDEKYAISYGVAGSSSNNEEGLVSFAPIQIRETFYLTERLDEKPRSNTIYVVSGLTLITILGIGYYYRRRRKKLRI
ncbi:MAG: LPXTG cell wall anchor domain-containing protein [Nanoarchaeota archaeon]|nr:LPXTG cell wall anchor domain-containing protein [Nanoarchaeota archaeon]